MGAAFYYLYLLGELGCRLWWWIPAGENWCWKEKKTAFHTPSIPVLPKSRDVLLSLGLILLNIIAVQYYWAVCWCLFAAAFPPFRNSLGTFSYTWLLDFSIFLSFFFFCSVRKLAEQKNPKNPKNPKNWQRFPCRCELQEWFLKLHFPPGIQGRFEWWFSGWF